MSKGNTNNTHRLSQWGRWRADTTLTQYSLPKQIQPWLCDTGSLTVALQNISDDTFKVNVLSQRVTVPRWHEQTKLQRPMHKAAFIREVELEIYTEAVVFARSIIPLALLTQGRNGLANLGTTPLGHLLFRDGRMRVSKREFAKINAFSQTVFARRTPYEYMSSTILVSEFFMPSLNKYID